MVKTGVMILQSTRGKGKMRHQASGSFSDIWNFTATYDSLTGE